LVEVEDFELEAYSIAMAVGGKPELG